MKKNYLYPLLCLCLFWLLPACSDSEEEFTDYLTPVAGSESAFTQGLSFSESAMTQTITFEAGNTWTATLEGTDVSSWCQVNPTKGNAGKSTISISARKNDTEEQRNATLIITTGTINKRITIIQSAGEKKPIAEWTDITANPDTWFSPSILHLLQIHPQVPCPVREDFHHIKIQFSGKEPVFYTLFYPVRGDAHLTGKS